MGLEWIMVDLYCVFLSAVVILLPWSWSLCKLFHSNCCLVLLSLGVHAFVIPSNSCYYSRMISLSKEKIISHLTWYCSQPNIWWKIFVWTTAPDKWFLQPCPINGQKRSYGTNMDKIINDTKSDKYSDSTSKWCTSEFYQDAY